MMVQFRLAVRDDVPEVVTLLKDDVLGQGRESGDMTPYLAAFDDMQTQGGNHLIVGVLGDRIVACYQFIVIPGISSSASRRAQIEGVRVVSDQRNRGIGARLIADAEERARAAGCAMIQLTTNQQRSDAQRFYDRAGFTPSHIGYKKPL